MKLDRRTFLGLGASAGITLLASPRAMTATTADNLYRRSIVIDGLGGIAPQLTDAPLKLTADLLEVIAQSGLSACHLTIGEVGSMPSLQAFESVIRDADHWDRQAELNGQSLVRIRSAADIRAAKAAGKMGLLYGLQDGVAFEDDLDRLSALYRAGIRVIQPTYNRRNLLGDGCMEPANAGLSRNGVGAIERMCDLGITIDMSHCGRQATADALAIATRPVSFTHTGCYALAEHPRHRTDEEMRAAADTGGIVGIYVMPYLAQGAQPMAADVIRHLEHAIGVAGEDHVSIGTDGYIAPTTLSDEYKHMFRENVRIRQETGIAAPFETEEGYLFAADLNDARRFEMLASALLDRGHPETRIEKILGGNLLRVFADTWND
jgi:membrane dipeptidase